MSDKPKADNPLVNAIDQFRTDALLAHNIYREKHETLPLQHCKVLSDYAQMWANRIAKEDKLIHSTPDWRLQYNKVMLGENLVATTDFKITGKGMSDMWYSESYKHDYDRENQTDTRSFTQMIWNSSKQVGFGRAVSKNNTWYAVALYHPIGNIEGQFPENVRPRPVLLEDLELDDIDNVYVSDGKYKYKRDKRMRRSNTAYSTNSRIDYLPVVYHLHDLTKTSRAIVNTKQNSKSTDRLNSGRSSLASEYTILRSPSINEVKERERQAHSPSRNERKFRAPITSKNLSVYKEKLELVQMKPEPKVTRMDKSLSPIGQYNKSALMLPLNNDDGDDLDNELKYVKNVKPKWTFPIVNKKSVNNNKNDLKPAFNKIGDRMEAIMKNPTIIQQAVKNKK